MPIVELSDLRLFSSLLTDSGLRFALGCGLVIGFGVGCWFARWRIDERQNASAVLKDLATWINVVNSNLADPSYPVGDLFGVCGELASKCARLNWFSYRLTRHRLRRICRLWTDGHCDEARRQAQGLYALVM